MIGVKLEIWVERRNQDTVIKETLMKSIDSFGIVINNRCILKLYLYGISDM